MEFLGPWECAGSVSGIFGHQDDQEGPECPKTWDLEDLGHLNMDFVIATLHSIPFQNPWDHGSYQEVFPGFVIIGMIRKECPETGDLEDLEHLDGDFVIVTYDSYSDLMPKIQLWHVQTLGEGPPLHKLMGVL